MNHSRVDKVQQKVMVKQRIRNRNPKGDHLELTQDLKALQILLNRTETRLESMAELAERKIALIRKADMRQMRALVRDEETLVNELHQQEGLRNKLMDRIGTRLGWPDRKGRSVSLRTMIERIQEDVSSIPNDMTTLLDRLTLLADRLKTLHERASASNQRAGEVSRQILSHFRHIFSAVTRAGESNTGYSRAGQTQDRGRKDRPKILDTIG
jgi:translation initiation factor 2B subunit (eIF-2B alpha/beta/delta family)